MKLLAIAWVIIFASGCGNKTSSDQGTNACAAAIGKGVDQMVGSRDKQMAAAPAEMKAKTTFTDVGPAAELDRTEQPLREPDVRTDRAGRVATE
jgi:hypothetical protein